MLPPPTHVRCSGCGDWGDAAHISACAGARIDRARRDGAELILRMAETQIRRRGTTDIAALRRAVAQLRGTGRAWVRIVALYADRAVVR